MREPEEDQRTVSAQLAETKRPTLLVREQKVVDHGRNYGKLDVLDRWAR